MSEVRSRIISASIVSALILFPSVIRGQSQAQSGPDSECLACHGQEDLKSESGKSVFIDEAKHKGSVHSVLNCTDCHRNIKEFPHPARIAKVNCAACHVEEAADVPKSVHSALGADACASCHGSAHYAQPAAALIPRLCAGCHGGEVRGLLAGVHGAAAKKGDPQAPTCQSCHGPIHKLLPAQDPNSPVAKKNLPDTCASCHSNSAFLASHQIPFAHPVESYKLSIHGREIAAGNEAAATCSDCHGVHEIYAGRDARSKVNHWNIPATCGKCHTEIAKIYTQSVHGQAVARGASDAPVCTDCHGEHVILAPGEAQSVVNPARVSSAACGRCHADERIDARYNLPADRVPTFADSFHGLALRAGSQAVADCASCHGVHNIFPSSDPRSTVNPANLAHTCGACHPGAGERFAIGPVHVLPESQFEHPIVRFIRHFYWVVIPLAIGFMFFHDLMDLIRKSSGQVRVISPEEAEYRLNRHFRNAHWLTLVSFPLLVISGFALKFPESPWVHPLLLWEGKFPLRGTVHRVAAVVLLGSLAYHIAHLLLNKRARQIIGHMAPRLRDLHDLQNMMSYNLGFSKTRPTFTEFSYAQKIEYWAFMWGTCVMAASGLLLWYNTLALRYFPKWVLDAATALHYYEAILATFAILIWHMYSVVFDPNVYPMDRVQVLETSKASAGGAQEKGAPADEPPGAQQGLDTDGTGPQKGPETPPHEGEK
jgi:cytochrome b subunit of formate dehydrogenase